MEKKENKSAIKRYLEANVFLFVPPFLVSFLVFVIYLVLYLLIPKYIGSNKADDLTAFYIFLAVMTAVWFLSIAITKALLTRLSINWINPKWGVLLFYITSFTSLTIVTMYRNNDMSEAEINGTRMMIRVSLLVIYAVISAISFYLYTKRNAKEA
jgi:hypothetical protein